MSATDATSSRSRSNRLYRALTYPLLSAGTTAAAVGVAAATYVLLVASANPTAVATALSASAGTVDDLLVAYTVGTVDAAGWLGLALTVAYAVLAGVTTVVVASTLRRGAGGAENLLGVAPGVLAAGCASCGAGVLPLLGVAGAYALFPFAGNLVRAVGVLALLFALARTGDPRVCSV
ncbi:hypothetical protein [Halorubellus salinus]|uniref:hypothetical protein n=1 Tax=Halorubellus salinus TaxID=755309 RepID=UPI001D05C468|nr:hypothetical protein [Halorubellus salinus]